MPYNTAPIKPSDAVTGTSSLPLARIKKIISMDEDIAACSNNAAFAISVATELFIRYLTEQAYNVVKSERKPRRNVQYKDFANAVSRIDNLEFLADVIPKTTTYRQVKEKRAAREAANQAAIEAGQMTLDGQRMPPPQPGFNLADGQPESSSAMALNGASNGNYSSETSPISPAFVNGSTMVDRSIPPGGRGSLSNENPDVQMIG